MLIINLAQPLLYTWLKRDTDRGERTKEKHY